MTNTGILHAHGKACGYTNTKGLFTGLLAQSEPTKTCTKCGETKALALFNKHKKGKDGLQASCKSCHASFKRMQAAKNQDFLAINPIIDAKKLCAKCSQSLSIDQFSKHSGSIDGLQKRCKSCVASYYKDNINHIKAKTATYQKLNNEQYSAYLKTYYVANKTKILEKTKDYRKAHPEMHKLSNQNRRAKKLNAGGKLSKGITQLLMSEQGGKCTCCLCDISVGNHSFDHFMPLALGGQHVDSNIQLLCSPCNSSKQDKHPLEWMKRQGIFTTA